MYYITWTTTPWGFSLRGAAAVSAASSAGGAAGSGSSVASAGLVDGLSASGRSAPSAALAAAAASGAPDAASASAAFFPSGDSGMVGATWKQGKPGQKPQCLQTRYHARLAGPWRSRYFDSGARNAPEPPRPGKPCLQTPHSGDPPRIRLSGHRLHVGAEGGLERGLPSLASRTLSNASLPKRLLRKDPTHVCFHVLRTSWGMHTH